MRKVNTVTKPTFYPLPLLEDVFSAASENNATIFSVCDFLSEFFQIHIDEASRPKTAIPIQEISIWVTSILMLFSETDVFYIA